MNALYFVTGFIYNVLEMLIVLIPMSIDVGSVCIRYKRFRWEFESMELADLLEEEAMRDD